MLKLHQNPNPSSRSKVPKRRRVDELSNDQLSNLGLSLTPCSALLRVSSLRGLGGTPEFQASTEKRRPATPSMNSEESETTTCFESGGNFGDLFAQVGMESKLLNLFS
ncbi:hypothetical protein U1Q18_011947 [Sarracenia purpurea var. burkii]